MATLGGLGRTLKVSPKQRGFTLIAVDFLAAAPSAHLILMSILVCPVTYSLYTIARLPTDSFPGMNIGW